MTLLTLGVVMTVAFGIGCTASDTDSYDFSPLDKTIRHWIERGYYPGASVIVSNDRGEIFHRSYGDYTEKTQVYVASAGKWVAAATIAAVVDDTALDWDDPVERWLPEFSDDPKGRIQLRRLLSHTSGIPDYLPRPRVDTFNLLTTAIEHILPLEPIFAPGSRFEYGGLGMQVAGRMAEAASGELFEDLFQSLIAAPTGMTRSHFVPVNTDGGHAPMLGGGLMTTAGDMIRFLDMIFHRGDYHGRRVLRSETVAELEKDQVGKAEVPRGNYVERAWGKTQNGIYGLGLWRERIDAEGTAWHVSSPGWAGSYPWINRRDSVYGVFVAHVRGRSARDDGFDTFHDSPIIPRTVMEIIHRHEGVTQGKVNLGNGASLYYEETGECEPVILVHAHTVDRWMWDGQFLPLSGKHRMIRYDLRGYGLSSMPKEGYHFTHENDLLLLMDSLGIGKAHLVGLSLGAMTIVDFVALHPERVLSASIAGGSWSGPKEGYVREPIMTETLQEHRAGWKRDNPDIVTDHTRLHETIDDWIAWQPQHKEMGVFVGEPVIDIYRAGGVDLPVLFINGEYDSHCAKNGAKSLASHITGAREIIIPDAGHFSAMDQPEAFNRALLEFWNRSDHPRVFVTAADLPALLDKIENTAWAVQIVEGLYREVDPIVGQPRAAYNRRRSTWVPNTADCRVRSVYTSTIPQ